MPEHAKVLAEAIKLFDCDAARITCPCGNYFLIVGWKARSEGEWFMNGEPFDFDFLRTRIVAHGLTLKSLWRDARRMRRIQIKELKKDASA